MFCHLKPINLQDVKEGAKDSSKLVERTAVEGDVRGLSIPLHMGARFPTHSLQEQAGPASTESLT